MSSTKKQSTLMSVDVTVMSILLVWHPGVLPLLGCHWPLILP